MQFRVFSLIREAFPQLLEQLGALLGGGCTTHHLMAMLSLYLIDWYRMIAVGKQLLSGEQIHTLVVDVQGRQQSRAFPNDSHPHMLVTMNTSFVALGNTKKPLQLQVVIRHFCHDQYKQTHYPTRHLLAQLLLRRHCTAGILLLQSGKASTPSGQTTRFGVERCGHQTNVRQLPLGLLPGRSYHLQTRINTRCQLG